MPKCSGATNVHNLAAPIGARSIINFRVCVNVPAIHRKAALCRRSGSVVICGWRCVNSTTILTTNVWRISSCIALSCFTRGIARSNACIARTWVTTAKRYCYVLVGRRAVISSSRINIVNGMRYRASSANIKLATRRPSLHCPALDGETLRT